MRRRSLIPPVKYQTTIDINSNISV